MAEHDIETNKQSKPNTKVSVEIHGSAAARIELRLKVQFRFVVNRQQLTPSTKHSDNDSTNRTTHLSLSTERHCRVVLIMTVSGTLRICCCRAWNSSTHVNYHITSGKKWSETT